MYPISKTIDIQDLKSLIRKANPLDQWPQKSVIPNNFADNIEQAKQRVTDPYIHKEKPNDEEEKMVQKYGQVIVS